MAAPPSRLATQLAGEPLKPAYLVASSEPLLLLEAADAIRAAARAQGFAEREVHEAEGNQRDLDWDALDASLHAPSLFSSRRLVEIRLPTGKPGKEGAKLIEAFCAAPAPDVTLLVTAGEWSRQHGGKWSQAIERVGRFIQEWGVKPHELPGWIEQRLRSRGLRADREAVQQLAERVQGNLLAAAQEVDKLALLDDGAPLDAAKMADLVADAARFDVFRLVDATLNGQPVQVARMLAGLRAEGESVHALMGMVVRELQTAASLARVQARGGNLNAAFKARGVWESKQPMYLRALKRHPSGWDRFLVEAGRVDRIAKGRGRTGEEPVEPWLALERLLLAVADARVARLFAA